MLEIDMRCKNDQFDSVSHPDHYTNGDIECIDAIKAALGDSFLNYCQGNVIKYVWRFKDKGGTEDLRKAEQYLAWMIEEGFEMPNTTTVIEIAGSKARCRECGTDCSYTDYEDWSWCPYCGREVLMLQLVADFESGADHDTVR